MISFLLGSPHAARLLALACLAAGPYAVLALASAVARTSSDRSRHARFWSPPRPARLMAVGRHSAAYRRRAYAATRAKHTTVRAAA